MPLSDFGGGADYSSVFAQLAAEDLRRIQSSTRQAVSQATSDQNAIDADTYSKWKNGKISDEAWLAYLRQRVLSSAGDPEDHQHWEDMLREHTDAIADAQVETQFRMNKITAQQLMNHYKNRMSGVEQNSPAWRELAGRYQELTDFVKAGGVHYSDTLSRSSGGSGGGGGGGGGGGSADFSALQADMSDPRNLVDPTNLIPSSSYAQSGDADDFLDGLMSDILRIDDLMRQAKENPGAAFLIDPLTGEQFPNSPETLTAIDAQYLRSETAFAAVKWSQGKVDDASRALVAKGKYISEVMAQHNTDRLAPVKDALEQSIVERMHAASAISDPQARMAVYRGIHADVTAFENGVLPGEEGVGLKEHIGSLVTNATETAEQDPGKRRISIDRDLPEEMRPAAAFYSWADGWKGLMDAFTDDALTPEQRNMLVSEAMQSISAGSSLTSSQIEKFAAANPNDPNRDATGEDTGLVGGLTNLVQRDGLRYGSDPGYQGPRFTYALQDNGTTSVVDADLTQDPMTGAMQLVPSGVDTAGLVQVAMRVGGRIVTAWAEPKPIDDPAYTAYRFQQNYLKDSKGNFIYHEGDWVPSSQLAKLGKGGIGNLVISGVIAKDSTAQGIQTPDGMIWYYDAGTGLLSPGRPPVNPVRDPITGGVVIGEDRMPQLNEEPFAGGVPIAFSGIDTREMQRYIRNRLLKGTLDLSGYKHRDADGSVIDGPPDIENMYWTPPHKTPMGRFNTEKLRLAMEKKQQEQAAAWRGTTNAGYVNASPRQQAGLGQFAAQLGVNIGARESFQRFQEQERLTADPAVARAAAFSALKARTVDLAKLNSIRLEPIRPNRMETDIPVVERPPLNLQSVRPLSTAPVLAATLPKPPKVGGFLEKDY